MSDIWFCSDHHFGHRNVINFCNRPYSSVEEMDDDLIYRHNNLVKKEDAVYFLGDFSWNQSYEKYKNLFSRMNGRKFYIIGNHDNKQNLIRCQKNGLLIDVRESKILNIGSDTIHLTHYPLLEWYNFHRNGKHFHGHTHCTLDDYCQSVDVGIDAWEYGPVEFSELKKYLEERCKPNIHPEEF